MKKIAIFASGTGSNALKIVQYFEHLKDVEICLIASNKSTAGVLEIAKENSIPSLHFTKSEFEVTDHVLLILKQLNIDLIVLAGFLWKIPPAIIQAFPNKIINIHPALLPKYGGKGMYGKYVHKAVYDSKDTESGMTIHYVNAKYDDGQVIFQATCSLEPTDNPSTIAKKVLKLEHQYYCKIIDKVLKNQ